MTTDRISGSAARALRVLDLVLAHGPISPSELTERSGLSRTAVHRAIHALIDQGYLRYQLGKAHVIVTAHLQRRLEGAFFSATGLDAIARAIDTSLKGRRLHCEIGLLTLDGPFQIVESTDTESTEEDDFFSSELVSILLSHFEPVDVTRITARILRDSPEGTRVEADFLDRFRLAQYQGYLWNAELGSLSVALSSPSETALAVRLHPRQDRRLTRKEATAALKAMHDALSDVFPNPDKLGL